MTLPRPTYNEIKEYVLPQYDTTLLVPASAQFLPRSIWKGTAPGRPVLFAMIDNTQPADVPRRFLAVRSTGSPDPVPQDGTWLDTVSNPAVTIVAHIFEVPWPEEPAE